MGGGRNCPAHRPGPDRGGRPGGDRRPQGQRNQAPREGGDAAGDKRGEGRRDDRRSDNRGERRDDNRGKFAGKGGDRQDRGDRKDRGPRPERDNNKSQPARFEAKPPRKEKPVDPDSPFAKLAALKEQLKK